MRADTRAKIRKLAESRTPLTERKYQGVILMLLPPPKYDVVMDVLERDQQSRTLLDDMYEYFASKFQITDDEYDALLRVRAALEHGKGWPADQHRNNIFKAANMLGMKLPSSAF